MASDDIPDNEQPEIIPKPPSHPITTSLLITSFFAGIIFIGFAWAELFGSYMFGAKTPVETGMQNHDWKEIKNNREGSIDHYAQDFPGEKSDKDMVYNVKKDLRVLESQQNDSGGGGDAPK